jgi:hypothetical protein
MITGGRDYQTLPEDFIIIIDLPFCSIKLAAFVINSLVGIVVPQNKMLL